MDVLVAQPLFLLGVVILVAGGGGVAVKTFGVETGAVTPGRSGAVAALGLILMAAGWWAEEDGKFRIVGLHVQWEGQGVLLCDSYQHYVGTIETTGKPQLVRYRVIASATVLADEAFTPSGEGLSTIGGRARLSATQLPDLRQQGIDLHLDVLSPVSVRSEPAHLTVNPACGDMAVSSDTSR